VLDAKSRGSIGRFRQAGGAHHREDALAFAREREIPVEVVETQELKIQPTSATRLRCLTFTADYWFTVLDATARPGFYAIADVVNDADDEGDFRPGSQAARHHHVPAPLL